MCGLVGFIGGMKNGFCQADTTVFKQMLYMDALRGEDSTGAFVFHNTGEVEVLKDVLHANEFVRTKEFGDMSTRAISKGQAIFGHNRKKTSGEINEKTAHPFVIDDEGGSPRYVFMHNGTLNNHTILERNLTDVLLKDLGMSSFTTPDTGVDSEILGNMLCHTQGDPRKIEEMLAKVVGAWACIWIDQEKEMLYMLRNKERPLSVGYSKIGTFVASESQMIHACTSRNNTLVDKYEMLEEDTLYSLCLGKAETEFTKEKLTIKKALPTTLVSGGGHTVWKGKKTTTDIEDWEDAASKNSMKRFRKKFLGTSISFWVDDYIQTTFPETPNFIVLGQNLLMDKTKHLVRGICRGVSRKEINEMVGQLVFGTISAVDWDDAENQIMIHVTDIKVNTYATSACH